MKQHQELKAKMDGRAKTIQQCADLGKILLAAGNPAADEVRLTNKLLRIQNTQAKAHLKPINTGKASVSFYIYIGLYIFFCLNL